MISEFLLNIVFKLVSWIFNLLPAVSFSVDPAALEYFFGYVKAASYMLPMETVATIVGLVVSFTVFRLGIALIKTVWGLMPVV